MADKKTDPAWWGRKEVIEPRDDGQPIPCADVDCFQTPLLLFTFDGGPGRCERCHEKFMRRREVA